jgi:hypothetical protein
VQGGVEWGSSAPSTPATAWHDSLLLLAWWQCMRVWVVSVRGQVGGMIERVRCRGEKRLLPLPLHVKGKKKHSTVQNDNVSCFFFFFWYIYYYYYYYYYLYFLFSCVGAQKWVTTIIMNGPCPKTSQPLIASSIIFYGKSNIAITLFQRTWPLSLGEQCFVFERVVVFVN